MAQLLVQVVDVNGLAAGATATIPHNLESNGVAVAPTLVMPDRATGLRVTTVTATDITVVNGTPFAQSAAFRLERGFQPEVDASTVTPMAWQGLSSPGTVRRVIASTSQVTGFAANSNAQNIFPVTAVLPAGTLGTASTVTFRVSGTAQNATGATLVTTINFYADADGTAPFTGLLTGIILGTGAANGIPNATPFALQASATVKANGANVGTLGGVNGSFNLIGASAYPIINTSNLASGVNTTAQVTLLMTVQFSVANPANNFTIDSFEVYVA